MVSLPEVSLEDAMVANVLQNEARLEGMVEKHGSGEGPRFRATLNVGSSEKPQIIEVTDVSPEEKARAAQIAVQSRAQKQESETLRYAAFKLKQLNEVEAVDFIRGLSDGDRGIYFDAEREGLNRPSIFEVFGEKPAPTKKTKETK